MLSRRIRVKRCTRCAKVFHTNEPRQELCSRSCAAKARVEKHGLGGLMPGARPSDSIFESTAREPARVVDRMLQEARERRLQYERIHGRQHTIVDGWIQRPGVSTIDRGGALEDA